MYKTQLGVIAWRERRTHGKARAMSRSEQHRSRPILILLECKRCNRLDALHCDWNGPKRCRAGESPRQTFARGRNIALALLHGRKDERCLCNTLPSARL